MCQLVYRILTINQSGSGTQAKNITHLWRFLAVLLASWISGGLPYILSHDP
jgi:hypothetical protein